MNMIRDEIVLIGPLAAGKTSVALRVSAIMGIPNFPLDRIKWFYRFRNGYDLARGTAILRTKGFGALLEYATPYFTPRDLKSFLDTFRNGVIDFGANQTVFSDLKAFNETTEILAPFRNIILLLPSPDAAESSCVLTQRIRERYTDIERAPEVVESYIHVNHRFLTAASNFALAKQVVYTLGRTVEQTAEEVITRCGFDYRAAAIDKGAAMFSRRNLPHFA
jgi:hypothetical protein